jgi:ABC-type transporter Mla MlaB component
MMAVRITRTADSDRPVLRIDGQLRSEDVPELAREYGSVEEPTVLELSHLQSADAVGVEALLQLIALGAEIRGASPYIELLLKKKS